MSLLAKVQNIRPSRILDEVDLDLTPIMNLFVILVPSLVSIAVFVHIAIIQINLPASALGNGSGPRRADLKLTVSMSSRGFLLALGDRVLDSIPQANGAFDLPRLGASLQNLRAGGRLTNPDEVVVAVTDGIIFDQVVSAMDVSKTSGFEKISLAAAAPESLSAPRAPSPR